MEPTYLHTSIAKQKKRTCEQSFYENKISTKHLCLTIRLANLNFCGPVNIALGRISPNLSENFISTDNMKIRNNEEGTI